MSRNPLELYIDRLKNDDFEQIHEVVSPKILDLEEEKDLSFIGDITISGQAYLAKNHLILDLKVKAKVQMPCSICNEKVLIDIAVNDLTQTIEICEIKSAIYSFNEDIRAALLLKVPQFLECSEGHCPQRNEVNKYLKKPSSDLHTPFSKLENI